MSKQAALRRRKNRQRQSELNMRRQAKRTLEAFPHGNPVEPGCIHCNETGIVTFLTRLGEFSSHNCPCTNLTLKEWRWAASKWPEDFSLDELRKSTMFRQFKIAEQYEKLKQVAEQ